MVIPDANQIPSICRLAEVLHSLTPILTVGGWRPEYLSGGVAHRLVGPHAGV
ncbi:hypothetical protein LAD67_16285 [Escherichia coli]|nr:hypothetical protein [Escherichia coli]